MSQLKTAQGAGHGASAIVELTRRSWRAAWPKHTHTPPGRSFWVAAIMCAITLVINIGYCLLARKMVKGTRAGSDVRSVRSSTQRQKMRASWLSLGAVPAAFWIILITQTMQGGTVGSWMNVSADVIRQTRGTTTTVAGYTSAVGQVIPIFLTPVLGTIMDRFGRRMYFVTATAALYVLAFALIQFTGVHTLVP